MSPGLTVFVRGIDAPSLLVHNDPALLQTVRAAIASVEPDAIVAMQTAGPPPFALQWSAVAAGLAAALGVMALGMACVGVSGMLAYLFDQRTRETAVRIALGARAADLILLIARDTAGALAAGAIGGLAVSLLAAPVLRSWTLGPALPMWPYLAILGAWSRPAFAS